MDSTPPRPPNLSELAEMGERARERMLAQRAAAGSAPRGGHPVRHPGFRVLAAALAILSALVLALVWTGQGQCAVPMWIGPGLCAMESVMPVWLIAVIGILLGVSYLRRRRLSESDQSSDSIEG